MSQHHYEVTGIVDTVAQDMLGPVMTHRHTTAAVRDFLDIARDNRTAVSKHPDDYQLVHLATIVVNGGKIDVLPNNDILITGRAAITATEKTTDEQQLRAL